MRLGATCGEADDLRRVVEDPHFAVALANGQRMQIFSASSAFEHPHPGTFAAGDEAVYRVRFHNVLGPDRYTVTPVVAVFGGQPLDHRERMLSIVVTRTKVTGSMVDLPYEEEITREQEPSALEAGS